jgi:hypothetical protein
MMFLLFSKNRCFKLYGLLPYSNLDAYLLS